MKFVSTAKTHVREISAESCIEEYFRNTQKIPSNSELNMSKNSYHEINI